MNIDDILSSIDSEIARLQQARDLLASIDTTTRGGKSAGSSPIKRKRFLVRVAIAHLVKSGWCICEKSPPSIIAHWSSSRDIAR